MCKGVSIMFDLFNHVPLYFNTIPKILGLLGPLSIRETLGRVARKC